MYKGITQSTHVRIIETLVTLHELWSCMIDRFSAKKIVMKIGTTHFVRYSGVGSIASGFTVCMTYLLSFRVVCILRTVPSCPHLVL